MSGPESARLPGAIPGLRLPETRNDSLLLSPALVAGGAAGFCAFNSFCSSWSRVWFEVSPELRARLPLLTADGRRAHLDHSHPPRPFREQNLRPAAGPSRPDQPLDPSDA